jgi:tetratricopeptide (TPR) repeat protein
MLATPNSRGIEPMANVVLPRKTMGIFLFARAGLFALAAVFFADAHHCAGQTNQITVSTARGEPDFAALARRAYLEARTRFQKETNNPAIGWQFGRACFEWAEFATSNNQRAQIAEEGIAACRDAIARDPKSAPARYYLGMNLGQLARTKGLGALRLVDEMEHEFKIVRNLDPHFDHAGADRNLGLLYLEAPAIASIGSRSRARTHLQRAAQLAPDYPENRLNLLEAYLRWGDRTGSRRELQALEALWPRARATFTGDNWTLTWKDWEERLAIAKTKVQDTPRALESPRQKQ